MEETVQTVDEAAPQPTEQPAPQRHKVTIEGKETEVDIEELRQGYQMKQASQRRFEEAATLRKQAEQFFDAFKKDPWTAAQQLGIDLDSAADAYYAEKLRLEMMDPKERELLEKDKKLKEYEEKEASYKKDLEKQEIAQLQAQAMQEIDVEIGDVLKQSGMKSSPKVVARIAELMLASLEKGERMPAAKAFERTNADLKDEVTTMLGSLPPDKILAMFPKDTVDAIRKHFVSQVTAEKPFSVRRDATPSATKREAPVKSTDEFFKRLEANFNK